MIKIILRGTTEYNKLLDDSINEIVAIHRDDMVPCYYQRIIVKENSYKGKLLQSFAQSSHGTIE